LQEKQYEPSQTLNAEEKPFCRLEVSYPASTTFPDEQIFIGIGIV